MGIDGDRVRRWDRGVDLTRFAPSRRAAGVLPAGRINVLYAGRLTREKGADLLAEAFLAARVRDERAAPLPAGQARGGRRASALGPHASFLGWLEGDVLARVYASADLFLFASRTDTFGQVLLEAQASGLPVVAVAEGGPCSIVQDGVTGLLRTAEAEALAAAVVDLARAPRTRERLAARARQAVRERTWERALGRLADGYRLALGDAAPALADLDALAG